MSLAALGATSLAWASPSLSAGGGYPASAPQSFESAPSLEAALSFGGATLPVVAGDAVPGAVSGDVMILHATNDHNGIDPKIPKGADLSKPPFSSYDSYKLVDRADLKMPKGEAKEVKLPDGGKLTVTYKDYTAAKDNNPARFAIRTSLEKADGKVFLPNLDVNAKANEWFFVAGQKHKDGILVIGIKVAP
ncbi:MAG: hypothetical protein U0271_12705 [Polyangiaceae bacterium]